MIEFKIATPDDAAIVAELSRTTFYDTFYSDNSNEDMQLFLQKNFTDEMIENELRDESHVFLLAYADGTLAGYAKLAEGVSPTGINSNKTVEIARIYSTKEKIGTGVGRALMQECIQIAKDKNKEVIWLGVWERNTKAINFYKKWGFEKFDEHLFMVGNDAQTDWLMKKVL